MQIVNTAHKELFLDLVKASHKSIKLCAPFVKEKSIQWILGCMDCKVSLELITSIKLINFSKGSSDIAALEAVDKKSGTIYNFPPLHAKFYIFDDIHAIITSANITPSGLERNFEYGIYITEKSLLQQICHDYRAIVDNKNTSTFCDQNILEIKTFLSGMPPSETICLPRLELYSGEGNEALIDKHLIEQNIHLSGWKRAMFNALCTMDTLTFTTQDYTRLLPSLQQQYPENNHVADKVRQVLQQLRDIGLIKFEGDGVYTKLWA